MGIFGRISDIFKAKLNTDLVDEPYASPVTIITFYDLWLQRAKLVSAVACATLQTRRCKLTYLRSLQDFLQAQLYNSEEDQQIEYEYFTNHSDIDIYKEMVKQAQSTTDKLIQQYDLILKRLTVVAEKLNIDLRYHMGFDSARFLDFEAFAQKVKAWETPQND
mgnify:CR=1 FL=1